MSDDLPTSGDPGVAPPVPGSLPRPAMWADGTQETPFRGMEGDTATPPSTGRKRLAFVAVAIMVAGVVLVGLSVALTSWTLLAAGVVIGACGAVLALRVRIMDDVSVSDSPSG